MTELALYDCTVISSYHTHSHYPDTDSTSPSTTLTMPAGSKGATRTICKDLSMFRPGMLIFWPGPDFRHGAPDFPYMLMLKKAVSGFEA